jgi:PleD family two-component response regulator
LKLERYLFKFNDNEIKITASFGVSGSSCKPNKTLKQYISESDKCLYKAKNEGKNKVVAV